MTVTSFSRLVDDDDVGDFDVVLMGFDDTFAAFLLAALLLLSFLQVLHPTCLHFPQPGAPRIFHVTLPMVALLFLLLVLVVLVRPIAVFLLLLLLL